MSADPTSLDNFDGTAILFPLPNLVLFPSVVQPLHIFEPRYRQMMADALAGDRLLALVLLQPGWEEDYHLAPPLHPIACLGKVFKEEQLPDGRYNLLLHGLKRIRLLEEVQTAKLYRSARVELLEDLDPTPADAQLLRDELGQQMPAWFSAHGGAADQIVKLLHSDLPLSPLCDIFCFALPLEVAFKQRLLEELDVARRVSLLLEHLEEHAPPPETSRQFPPRFSDN